ncbi:integrin alpha [Conexibacter woesei]|uniref:integrin alpha n=1 Tax=Conexibacter woesei TaxID=191495 RepID=UPI0004042BB2|nr:integrin alpha [Conexibacter woesei]
MTVPRLTAPLGCALALLLSLTLTPPRAAHAAPIDLRTHPAFEIVGPTVNANAGNAVSAAGDVNGDGIDDVIVGAPLQNAPGRFNGGSAYVVFGRRRAAAAIRRAPIARIAAAGAARRAQGFRIVGPNAQAHLGATLAAVGDVNGDGLADVAVGARTGTTTSLGPVAPVAGAPDILDYQGAVYIVYGKRDGAAVDLAHLDPAQGMEILGPEPAPGGTTGFGGTIAGGRDVDGDGRPDLVVADQPIRPIGALPDPSERSYAYVISGAQLHGGTILHADRLGAAGYRVGGYGIGLVSLAADMNGDGRAELVINGFGTGAKGTIHVRVVFGRPAGSGDVTLDQLGPADGFAVYDGRPTDVNGIMGATGGDDVNGDGRGDLIMTGAEPLPGHRWASATSVVFGAPSGDTVWLNRPSPRLLTVRAEAQPMARTLLPSGRYTYLYENPNTRKGEGIVTSAIVGPGRIAMGVVLGGSDPDERHWKGAAVILPGRRGAGTIALHGRGSVEVRGAYAGDRLGSAVAGAGDFDGDGRPDVMVAAQDAMREGRAWAGAVFVLSGAAR